MRFATRLPVRPTSFGRLSSATPFGVRGINSYANFKIPTINNEPNKHYIPGSPDRRGLELALAQVKQSNIRNIPLLIGGKEITTTKISEQLNPATHKPVAYYSEASKANVEAAIEAALAARGDWAAMPWSDRASIFLKAADLISTKYRYDIMALTMAGQGKNAWQAEIDSAAELCDFFRFGVKYAEELYSQQPAHHSPGVWKGVIQFVPGDAEEVTSAVLSHPDFAALHFTGSTTVFRSLYGKIATGVAEGKYKGYPRIVGETGGKNFHLVHQSADVRNAVVQTVRGAFEYQGQKCSATSRTYVASSIADDFVKQIVEEVEDLKVGDPADFTNFCGPVIHEGSFYKLTKVIDEAKQDPELELLVGGNYDSSKGWFIEPTVYLTKNADHPLLSRELFGPILVLHAYDDASPSSLADICTKIEQTSEYGLTGSVFAQDRNAIRFAEDALRNAAGNFYINCKSTGAVVGQQPFGGARASGTNDKAGSANLLSRFVSLRSIKEEFTPTYQVAYPSNFN
ncbi:delta-1-pyrroline-5-carboxylate dehydrogenase [Talaromyces pinophilus]|uniref:L-glutamate gamma-semialdehyde dehydrogenase n=1 Tax=Talaromyces pinophilus TaxID=128442 RepID=A0A478EC06_TALPI|nr:delta-1-pyrroline-5-carboxylate dehydrogenase [Talaromyces pinophilus]